MGGPILAMRDVCKSFPGVQALESVSLSVMPGEVHVLLGENGAGKSTLMKIAAGVYEKDSGEILFEGSPVHFRRVKDAEALGISIIHQELNLLPYRTVAENIYLGREPLKFGVLGIVDRKRMHEESAALLSSLGVSFAPDMLVKDLGIAQQQMVEVVKALSVRTKLLIMDEPTSSLTQREIDHLFDIIRQLKSRGVSIIYISHRMDEIKRIGDRITILRDGRYVATVGAEEMEIDELIQLMVGKKVNQLFRKSSGPKGEEVIRAENLTGLRFRDVSLRLRKGEIVGLAGLVGSGRTEVVKAVFGYDPVLSGRLFIRGKEVRRHSTTRSVKEGMGFLPEDRKSEGLILDMSVRNNLVHASLGRLSSFGFLNRKKETEVAERYKESLKIATPDVTKLVRYLSGGNQQKVVLGKWLCTDCDILIFDEPTRGIDVGAKAEIYELMSGLAEKGKAILIVSSEQKEIVGLCDRVYVMHEGRVRKELEGGEITQERIVTHALGKDEKNGN